MNSKTEWLDVRKQVSPMLLKVLDKQAPTTCPRCGGELLKDEHLDKGFVPTLEVRCAEGCGFSKICA